MATQDFIPKAQNKLDMTRSEVAPGYDRLARANKLLSGVPEYRGALGSFDPLKAPTVVSRIDPASATGWSPITRNGVSPAPASVQAGEAARPVTPWYEPPKQLNPMRGIDHEAGTFVGEQPSPVSVVSRDVAPPVSNSGVVPRRTGVFVGGREIQRGADGDLESIEPALSGEEAQWEAARSLSNSGLDTNAAAQVALDHARDPNKLGIGEVRVVAPNGRIFRGNGTQVSNAVSAVRNFARPAIGSTTPGGGIVVSNDVERGSGGVMGTPRLPSESIRRMVESFDGPHFNLRPSRDERVAGVIGRNQLAIEQQQAQHALTLARAGFSPDQIKHAIEREKMQNEKDIAAGRDRATVSAADSHSKALVESSKNRGDTSIERARQNQMSAFTKMYQYAQQMEDQEGMDTAMENINRLNGEGAPSSPDRAATSPVEPAPTARPKNPEQAMAIAKQSGAKSFTFGGKTYQVK